MGKRKRSRGTRWTVRGHRVIYQGRLVRLDLDDLEFGGRQFQRENLIHPGAAAVVPVLANGDVVLVRQFRYAVQRELLEIPAGTLERGERPAACARRELMEEAGFRAGRLRHIGRCYPVPGYSTERIEIFVATGLTPCRSRPEFDEQLTVRRVSQRQILRLMRRGTIVDAKSLVGLFYYLWYNKSLC